MRINTSRLTRNGLAGRNWVVLAVYALLSVLTFARLLFQWHQVISMPGTDITTEFFAWRHFGFSAIAHGDFPFWNPHLSGGGPCFSNMQYALLYPPNLIFLFLPTAMAINWSVALHVWLMGSFTYLWLRGRGPGLVAAAFGGATAMFCAPFFLQIFAGHLTNISAMVWVPLLLLALERWFAGGSRRWLGLGAVAVAMQIFAGHPQYLYYTGLCTGLFTLLHLALFPDRRLRGLAGFVAIYLLGAALGAVQLLPALVSAGESVRAGGVAYHFARTFSLSPADIATLIGPSILGNIMHMPNYDYFWEICLYFGIIALLLSVLAVVRLRDRHTLLDLLMVGALMVLALGAYTPLFKLLYLYLPGFDLFRGSDKFGFFLVLFGIALSARGAQWLLDCDKPLTGSAVAVIGIFLLILLSIYIFGDHHSGHSDAVAATLFRAAMLLVAAALLLWLRGRKLWSAGLILLVIGVTATMLNAWVFRQKFPVKLLMDAPVVHFMKMHRDDGRILNLVLPNAAMLAGAYEIWGYDPCLLKRWAQFCAVSQGYPPAEVSPYLKWSRTPEMLALTCLHWIVQNEKGKRKLQILQAESTYALPPAFFVPKIRIEQNGERQLALLDSDGFNPRKQATVERKPPFAPSGTTGKVRMKWIDSDHIDLRTDNAGTGFVVLSVAYAAGWHAVEVKSGKRFSVMPADYAFIGLSLPPGRHHLVLSYRPLLFKTGLIVSIVAAAILLLGLWV